MAINKYIDLPTPIKVHEDGSIDANVTGTIITDPDVNIHDSAGLSLTSTSGSLNVNLTNPLSIVGPVSVTQGTTPWVVSGSITTSPDVNIHDSAGNTLNSTANALNVLFTNTSLAVTQGTSPWVVGGTVTANQGTSALPGNAWYTRITDGTVTVGVDPATFSLNVNIVGPQNFGGATAAVRTAAMVGNTSGIADFGAGTTSAQTLRVVLPTNQSAIPVTQSTSPWVVSGSTTVSGTVTALQGTSPWVVSGTVAATQSGAWTTGRTWSLASGTDSVSAVQSGTWNINNISGTISLPTGASTSALQTTGNASLSSIDTKTPALGQTTMAGSTPVTIASNQSALAVSQSGTWNITNISGTVSLPTGASTAALQTTGNTSLSTIATNTASLVLAQGSATAGQTGSLTLGAVTTAAPAYTTAQTSPLSLTTLGGLRTDIASFGGTAVTLGQKVMASSIPVVIASDQSALPITTAASQQATYSAAITGAAPVATATDFLYISGSASKTIKIKKIVITANRTGNTTTDILLVRRSTANTGGTGTTLPAVTHDTANAAATSVPVVYSTNPTTGTLVGAMRSQKQWINVAATGTTDVITWSFGEGTSQEIVLRGTAQAIAVNLNGQTITVGSFDMYIEWTEQ